MTVTPSTPIVGIFKDRAQAEQAIDALYATGFTAEQVRYSAPGTAGSILADLKNLFTGQSVNSGNITNDLIDMGLSDTEAQYYANEYTNGNTILAVLAAGRDQEVLNALHQSGAYNVRTNDPWDAETTSQQAVAPSVQQTSSTSDGNPFPYHDMSDEMTQQQPVYTGASPFQNTYQDEASSGSDTEVQSQQPADTSMVQEPEYQPTQPFTSDPQSASQDASLSNGASSSVNAQDQAPVEAQTVTEEGSEPPSNYASAPPSEETSTPIAGSMSDEATIAEVATTPVSDHASVSASEEASTPTLEEGNVPTADSMSDEAAVAEEAPVSEHTSAPVSEEGRMPTAGYTSDEVSGDTTPFQVSQAPSAATAESVDEWRQLQEQLQAAQQQLQDAKAQLQAAKEHEAQIQTIKEREQKLQASRQQLQDVQAQLQATLAELNETKARISQYA